MSGGIFNHTAGAGTILVFDGYFITISKQLVYGTNIFVGKYYDQCYVFLWIILKNRFITNIYVEIIVPESI